MADITIQSVEGWARSALEERAARDGSTIEAEALKLLQEALTLRNSPWDDLYRLADHWVRQDLGEDPFNIVEMIRADRDGMRDCEEFEAIVDRIRSAERSGERFRPTHG
jgi:plasmid stability protein